MRRFIESVLSDSADLLLSLSDWLCDTLEGPLTALLDYLGMLDAFSWTWILLLVMLGVGVVL